MARSRRFRAIGARHQAVLRGVCVLGAWLVLAGLPSAQPDRAPPPLVVIGIDGFRSDYLERAEVPALRALAASGVRGAGLIPPFPSKTFPSFTTIATGLHPVRHGIVANTMVDPAIPARFALSDHDARSDPRWWLGEPVWITAERQGRRAAGLFWPGDDVAIGGRRPTAWSRYDDDFPHESRVDRVLTWFTGPPSGRPALAMVYFSLVDVASHAHGPDSREALAAASAADALVGRLLGGLAARGLDGSRLNVVVVSDHGMIETHPDRTIVLDQLVDLDAVDVIETGPMLRLAPRGGPAGGAAALAALLARLRTAPSQLTVYRGEAMPERFHATGSPRNPPIVGLADDGWLVLTRAERDRWLAEGGGPHGDHGFDPATPLMHGVFVAAGPSFRRGLRVPAFASVHLYELFCRLLDIRPADNDGDPQVTEELLSTKRP